MTRYTLTILDEHYKKLREVLLRDANENGALILCGRSQHHDPWTGEIEERALVKEIVEIEPDNLLERTPTSLTWSTTPLYQLAKRATERNDAICIAHSHPGGGLYFSEADDIADQESMEIVYNRIDTDRPHFTMVMDNEGNFIVRAYESDLKPRMVELTRVIGSRWHFRYPGRGGSLTPYEFDRQVRAFGAQSVEDLRKLRIGIVGCGGTGSAVAAILARVGASQVVLIDPDRVDRTNLNRLHFSKRSDAILGRYKVDVVAEGMADIGLADSIIRIPEFDDSQACRDALCSCDVVFGCTDDHLGRNLLNRLAHFYLIPVIDLGVLIEPDGNGSYDSFDGRVTVIQPGSPCQVCRKLINPQRMLEESMRRRDPILYEQHRRAGYIEGGDDPSPIVVTFTTEVAAVATNELLQRLTGFRGESGHCSERVRRLDEVKDADSVPGGKSKPTCKLCGKRTYDGRGDMEPFLDSA